MIDKNSRLVYLYNRVINSNASLEEAEEFWRRLKKAGQSDPVWEEIYNSYEFEDESIKEPSWAIAEAKLFGSPRYRKYYRLRWAIAASILVIIASAAFLNIKNRNTPAGIADNSSSIDEVKAPSGSKATVLLANGSTLFIDSVLSEETSVVDGLRWTKLASGEIVCNVTTDGNVNRPPVYNTIKNPRGSKILSVVLPDGSKIFMNAGSSITFPTAFLSDERKVSMTGEIYFDVFNNKNQPFKVLINNELGETPGGEVTVLGTEFNVTSYANEKVKVVLYEGSVKVRADDPVNKGRMTAGELKPGQQATIGNEGVFIGHADLDKAIAWKQGMFDFRGVHLKELMNQLERWYDIQVSYEDNVSDIQFYGKINRNANLSTVLKVLSNSDIHYQMINDRKLLIKK